MIDIELEAALSGLSQIMLRAAYPQPLFALIGQSEVDNVKARIRNSKRTPSGEEWAPWADSTAQQRAKKGNAEQGLLWDRGDLMDSIHFVSGHTELDIGSDKAYAGWVQDGTEKMPAREYLGWSDHPAPFYEALWIHYLETGTP